MEKVVCVVSKPLQYMVCDTITDTMDTSRSLIVVPLFYGADSAVERLKRLGQWRSVTTAKNRFFSLVFAAYMRPDKLFVDSDVGLRLFIYLLLFKCIVPRCTVYIYEEGVGSYRNDFYQSGVIRRVKKNLYRTIGGGWYLGGSRLVSGIYIYNPKAYSEVFCNGKQLFRIKRSLSDYCRKKKSTLTHIFSGKDDLLQQTGSVCVLYFSEWIVDVAFVKEEMDKIPNATKVLKLHPHIKVHAAESIASYFNVVVPNSVPGEILLIDAMDKFEHIYVYHHGSSVTRYISGDNVQFIKLPTRRK